MNRNVGRSLLVAACCAIGLSALGGDCGSSTSGNGGPPTSGNHNMSKGAFPLAATCTRTSDCVWPYVCAYNIADTCPTGTNACSARATCVYPHLDGGVCQPTTFCPCPGLTGSDPTQYPSGPYTACSDGVYAPTPVDTTMACLKSHTGAVPSLEAWD